MSQEPTVEDRRRFARALTGFYLSCTGFGIGATVGAAALIVFPGSTASNTVATVSIAITLVCGVLAFWTLKVSRGG